MRIYAEDDIVSWAINRGIYSADGSTFAQLKGIAEEVVEATEAYTKMNWAEGQEVQRQAEIALKSELGDIYVFWVNACHTAGINPSSAVDAAVEKITERTGSMVDGRFVKD